jgi:PAS domain S-box-containing protein
MEMLELAVTMDSKGMVREWASQAEELFGYASDDAMGRSLGDLIVPEKIRPYHEMGLKRYLETREPRCVGNVVDIDALHEQGHTVSIQMKIVPREVGEELFFDAHIEAGADS